MNYIAYCRKTNNRLNFEFESCELLEKTEGVIKNGQSRDISNIGYTRHRTKTIQRHRQHWVHKTQDEDNPETSTTLGTQDTGRRQSRDIGNIGYTRHRTKTIQRHRQHWVHKTQDEDNPETSTTLGTQDTGRRQSRDIDNIGYTRHRTNTSITQKTKKISNTDPTKHWG
jgi:hypothetical protein